MVAWHAGLVRWLSIRQLQRTGMRPVIWPMNTQLAILVLLIGSAIAISTGIRRLFAQIHLPPMVGYIVFGLVVVTIDSYRSFLPGQTSGVVGFLSHLGIITLLFQVGVDSKIKELLNQFGQASVIGLVSIASAGVLAFAAGFWILHLSLFTSLLVGAAMVATSVGVTASIWEDAGAINSKHGQLLLDVAEFDDMAGVVLMALLFALVPTVTQETGHSLLAPVLKTALRFIAALLLYGGACVLFAHYAEPRVTRFLRYCEEPPEETLTVIAIGIIIAACAGLLGFSVAIGAFFAGLIFSRDPESIKSRTAFTVVYHLFTPFFFIGIGLRMRPDTFGPALVPALVLIGVAFAGKFLGTAISARFWRSWQTSTLLGLSMVPRAEIAMIISERALALEEEALPNHIFSAIILTCLATCLVPPVILNRLLLRWQSGCPGQLRTDTEAAK